MLDKLELLFPPLPLTLSLAIIMWLLNKVLPLGLYFTGQSIFASFLFIIGVLFIVPAALSFFRAKTTVDPRTPEKSNQLVISGLYKVSRNPMYLGMVLCLFALSFAQGNIISLLISFASALYLTRFQIMPEERFLREKFGESYTLYYQKVRRWL